MSLEQIEELLTELGDKMPAGQVKPLRTEYEIKLFMEKLPGLSRDTAKILITSDESSLTGVGDVIADELSLLFSRQKLTPREITDLQTFCGVEGKKTFARAFRRYSKDPVYKAREDLLSTQLLKGLERQVIADEKGVEHSGEADYENVEAVLNEHEEMMRARAYCEELGIESAADWRMMLDALNVIFRADKQRWLNGDRQQLNVLTKRARRLFDAAKNYQCSPSRLWEWRQLRTQKLSPITIYTRPDGKRIWGTGELVVETKTGALGVQTETIFGIPMAQGDVPTSYEMDDIVRKAFPDEFKKPRVS